MSLAAPYPVELLRVAKKVVWCDSPEGTLADLPKLLAQVMVYGSEADVETVERFAPAEEFRNVLQSAPAGVFTDGSLATLARTIRHAGTPFAAAPERAADSPWLGYSPRSAA